MDRIRDSLRQFALAAALLLFGCTAQSDVATPGIDTLQATTSLQLSVETADLSRIGMFVVSPRGEIVVTQPDDHVVVVFSADGERNVVGRDGEGPGEFRYPVRAGFIGDSLWVVDARIFRISLFDESFKFIRSFSEPREALAPADRLKLPTPQVEIGTQALLSDGSVRIRAIPRRGELMPSWAEELDTTLIPLVRVSADGDFRNIIAFEERNRCWVRYPVGERRSIAVIPFCAPQIQTGWEWGEQVAVVDTPEQDGDRWNIRARLFEPDGTPTIDVELPFTPVPVSTFAIDSQRAALEESLRDSPERLAAMPELEVPPFRAPILRAVVGRDGTVWLEEEEGSDNHTWLIVGTTGQVVGRMVLPPQSILQAAELRQVWTVEESVDGLFGIGRYELTPQQ